MELTGIRASYRYWAGGNGPDILQNHGFWWGPAPVIPTFLALLDFISIECISGITKTSGQQVLEQNCLAGTNGKHKH
jgi:hypothetical protein